jgi:UDP-N-acetylglucosamine--N-acetylmuramyl-(pentapeptide) pyrophosphoryl-undecaprenol N-acetylglucosamine transferase
MRAETSEPLRVVVAAGGTGGHLFPAEALANALVQRGAKVDLISDDRAQAYAATFPAPLHQITSGTVTGSGILGKLRGVYHLFLGTRECRRLYAELRPEVVVGFGGYPTVPPVYAAATSGIPTIIHEANAVIGRANKFLAAKATRVATGFPLKDQQWPDKTVVTGNPVRPPVLEAASLAYPSDGRLHLLVTGGSQGARVMSEVVPDAIRLLSAEHRGRLVLTQQARAEDLNRVADLYRNLGVAAVLQPFFRDLPARIAGANLVIGRSGASTCAELAVIGRASILVPLPGSIDQDQAANARVLAEAGGALVQKQPGFTADWLASQLAHFIENPGELAAMAEKARSVAVPDATERLADLVFAVARR